MDFFTSDTHFWHRNILHLGKGRPFSSIEEMNEKLIENWNSVVGTEDNIFHLGDFGFCGVQQALSIIGRLNGKKHLIIGNHDRRLIKDHNFFYQFLSVQPYLARDFASQGKTRKVILFHYPMEEWESYYFKSWHLYGHTHKELVADASLLRYHAGVDSNGFKPVSFDEVFIKLTERQNTIYGK